MSSPDEPVTTRVLSLSVAAVEEAVRIIRAGRLVAFPTDTVYGVGCDLWRKDALERLYWAKQRPRELAIPVLVSAPDAVLAVACDLPPEYGLLAERFWPGPLTLVVARQPRVPSLLSANGDTVAVRMPAHSTAIDLLARVGGALAVTSANLSGRPAPRTAQGVLADLEGRVDLVLDGGECPDGVASSIVDLMSTPPVLLREGGVAFERLCQALPTLGRGRGS